MLWSKKNSHICPEAVRIYFIARRSHLPRIRAGMSFQNFYDGGSVEIHPASNIDSTIREIGENGEVSEYVCVRYRIANKQISAMESRLLEHEIAVDKYAAALQNETQLREVCQRALYDEQTKHSACRAAYAGLLKFLSSHHTCSEQVPRAYEAEISQLLMLVAYLDQKIQNMTEQHTSALCIAADRIARTESALDRIYMQESDVKNPASDLEHDQIDSP